MDVWLIVLIGCAVLFGVIAFFLIREVKRPQHSGLEAAPAQETPADERDEQSAEKSAAAQESPVTVPVPPVPDELPDEEFLFLELLESSSESSLSFPELLLSFPELSF